MRGAGVVCLKTVIAFKRERGEAREKWKRRETGAGKEQANETWGETDGEQVERDRYPLILIHSEQIW